MRPQGPFPRSPNLLPLFSVVPGELTKRSDAMRANKCILCEFRVEMELLRLHRSESTQDATPDYPQSRRASPSRSCTERPRWVDDALRPAIEVPIRAAGQRPARSARAAGSGGPATIAWRSGGSSSCPCGRSPSCSSTRCGGSIVRPAAWWSEQVPWAEGKCRLTTTYQWFLAGWARRLSWQEVAEVFRTTWEHVRDSVRHAVLWGLVHRDLTGVEAIGVDEIQWRRGPSLPDAGLSDRRRLPPPAVDRPRADRREPAARPGRCWARPSAAACGSCAATCGSPT